MFKMHFRRFGSSRSRSLSARESRGRTSDRGNKGQPLTPRRPRVPVSSRQLKEPRTSEGAATSKAISEGAATFSSSFTLDGRRSRSETRAHDRTRLRAPTPAPTEQVDVWSTRDDYAKKILLNLPNISPATRDMVLEFLCVLVAQNRSVSQEMLEKLGETFSRLKFRGARALKETREKTLYRKALEELLTRKMAQVEAQNEESEDDDEEDDNKDDDEKQSGDGDDVDMTAEKKKSPAEGLKKRKRDDSITAGDFDVHSFRRSHSAFPDRPRSASRNPRPQSVNARANQRSVSRMSRAEERTRQYMPDMYGVTVAELWNTGPVSPRKILKAKRTTKSEPKVEDNERKQTRNQLVAQEEAAKAKAARRSESKSRSSSKAPSSKKRRH
eukprot:NODE_770_length_1354_cov_163.619923_g585_i0.p1 GENE.NODE_770_length_1354_cov_163.619923_g585_i0~~NODE_770_length_1354_cov_163.619923_g585_i0.p1  ORF type:complete len:385 (+),score=84.88 NODE_770_length_1354_cov_163.619923_g585_i0:99-1253(+)